MRIRIVAVGKLKEAHYRAAVDDYVGRLKRYLVVDEIELKDEEPARVVAAMKKAIGERTKIVALTIDGKMRSSEELAIFIEQLAREPHDVAFVLGGADGIPPEIIAAAHHSVSLTRLTLPHRLARLVLVEQLYRAMTIRKGEPYHHGG